MPLRGRGLVVSGIPVKRYVTPAEVENRPRIAAAVQEEALARAADALWERFSRHPATAAAARNMLQHAESSPARNASRIGGTPWNAYAFNIDFRTGVGSESQAHYCFCLFVSWEGVR